MYQNFSIDCLVYAKAGRTHIHLYGVDADGRRSEEPLVKGIQEDQGDVLPLLIRAAIASGDLKPEAKRVLEWIEP